MRKIIIFINVFLFVIILLKIYSYKQIVETPTIITEQPKVEVPQKQFTFEESISLIDEVSLKQNLTYLASDELEGRMSGKRGNIKAAEFIKNKYQEYGLNPEYQKFSIKRTNPGPKQEIGDDFTCNIIAYKEGTTLKDEVIVVGAHMDHIGYGPSMSRSRKIATHPGADDNASGTVALLEIAEAISKLNPKRTIVFQSYSAEEMGLIGSRYYCENPLFPKDNPNISKHIFMLNMDMVGYLGKGQFKASWGDGNSSLPVQQYINQLNTKYNFAKNITSRGSGGSDHAPFYNKKVPVAFLHTGLHAYYHTPEDTADKINYKGIESIARYALELVWLIANDEQRPVFNTSTFKEMDYTHDHGHEEFPHTHN